MDRAEYREKIQEIKRLDQDGKYKEAAAIISEINWKRVKSASTLTHVGIIMGKAGRFDEGKELLLSAYDRAPIGRTSVYWLVELALRQGNITEAEEYFNEYLAIAPEDSRRYILEYKIGKAKNRTNEELLPLLETLREKDFTEEWSYELAYLYHKSGHVSECVRLCDEIILYFGEGYYVEKAMELKMIYQPLSDTQVRKYEEMKLNREGITRVHPEDVSGYAEILHEDMSIPTVKENTAMFNTIDLQAEVARSMQQIREATDKKDVDQEMDNIRKLIEESHIPIPEPTQEQEEEMYADIESDAEIDGSLELNFQEMLAEEEGGQLSMNIPPSPMVEQQVTGQMSIDDVLAAWERKMAVAERTLEDARQRKLESAKAKAIARSEDIIGKIQEVAVELEKAGVQEGPSKAEVEQQKLMETEADVDRAVDEIVDGVAQEALSLSASQAFAAAGVSLEEDPEEEPQAEELPAEPETPEEAEQIDPMQTEADALAAAIVEHAEKKEVSSEADSEDGEDPASEEMTAELTAEETEALLRDDTKRIPNLENQIEAQVKEDMADAVEIEDPEEELADEPPITALTQEQAEIFSYFMPVAGMEKQVCSVLEGVRGRRKAKTSAKGNILIEGASGSGKTMLATDLIKVLQKTYPHDTAKVGRINAESLNQKTVADIIGKIRGGYLIIEHAGKLSADKAAELSEAMEEDTGGLLVIMEDSKQGIQQAISSNVHLAAKFTEKLRIPIFTNDELVTFGKTYANDNGYTIDDLGVLALYNRIGNIRTGEHPTTLDEVKKIIDAAIEHAEKSGVSKAVRSFFSKRYDDEDNVILREKDFE